MSLELKELLESAGLTLRDFGKEYRAKPIYRESNNNTSLAIDKVEGNWHDYSWNRGGKLPELLKLLGKEGLGESFQAAEKNYSEIPLTDKTFDESIVRQLAKDYSYWIDRGISAATIKEFGGGVDLHWKLKNRYVFPVLNGHKKIIGLFGRDITNNPNIPKYKILGGKKDFRWPLYLNHEIIQSEREVILSESPACVLKAWDCGIKNMVCLFGTDISSNLINLLVRYNLKSIIIATNNEPDNNSIGNNAAKKIKGKLLEFFDPTVVTIKLPTRKDFAEMSCEEIYIWKKEI